MLLNHRNLLWMLGLVFTVFNLAEFGEMLSQEEEGPIERRTLGVRRISATQVGNCSIVIYLNF